MLGLYLTVTYQTAASVGRQQQEKTGWIGACRVADGAVISLVVALAIYTLPSRLGLGRLDPTVLEPASHYWEGAVWITFPAIGFMVMRGLAAGFAPSRLHHAHQHWGRYYQFTPEPSSDAGGGDLFRPWVSMGGDWDGLDDGIGLPGIGCGIVAATRREKRIGSSLANPVRAFGLQTLCHAGNPIMLAHAMEGGLFTLVTVLAGTFEVLPWRRIPLHCRPHHCHSIFTLASLRDMPFRVGQAFGCRALAGMQRHTRAGADFRCLLQPDRSGYLRVVSGANHHLFSLGATPVSMDALLSVGVDILFIAALFLGSGWRSGDCNVLATCASSRHGTDLDYRRELLGDCIPRRTLLDGILWPEGTLERFRVGLGCAALTLIALFQWKIHQLAGATRAGNQGH